jgi:hypothetical protein
MNILNLEYALFYGLFWPHSLLSALAHLPLSIFAACPRAYFTPPCPLAKNKTQINGAAASIRGQ